jgi:hypothetical protein
MMGFGCRSILALLAIIFVVSPAFAQELVNKDDENVAIKGYDTVAYFTEGRPVQGKPEFEHGWQDARWRFASAEHRDLFKGDPATYAPRYGGFCSAGMTVGQLVPVDPEAWVIVEGRLYLASAKQWRDTFAADSESNIAKADANWKKLDQAD